MEESTPRRGRPPEYDRDAALAGAGDVFWSNGYSGTTLAALAEAMGMNRPSVHAAFGDKRELYFTAFDRYADASHARLANLLAGDEPLAEQLTRIFDAAIAIYTRDREAPRGCFLIGTALAEAPVDVDIRDRLRAALERIDTSFAERFERARAAGTLAPDADPRALGACAGALLNALAVRARAGASRESLKRIATQAASALTA